MIGRVDKFEIEGLLERVKGFRDKERDAMFLNATKAVANNVMDKAEELTPVGDYSDLVEPYNAMVGGTLKGSWETEKPIKNGHSYSQVVRNPIEYASYVNYGHTQNVGKYVKVLGKRLKKPWVKGQFFLEKAVQQVQLNKESIIEEITDAELKRVFNRHGNRHR